MFLSRWLFPPPLSIKLARMVIKCQFTCFHNIKCHAGTKMAFLYYTALRMSGNASLASYASQSWGDRLVLRNRTRLGFRTRWPVTRPGVQFRHTSDSGLKLSEIYGVRGSDTAGIKIRSPRPCPHSAFTPDQAHTAPPCPSTLGPRR